MNLRLFLCSFAFALPSLGTAQVTLPVNSAPVSASGENSRLRQMETIYQLQLRAKHIPLLSKYITDLQALAEQAPDPMPYQQEIERIQGIISRGGVVDLAAAVQSLKTPAEAPITQPLPAPMGNRRAFIALTPALARSISPTPDGSASPEAAAIGEIDWRIDSLPAGTYDIVLNYACPKLDMPLQVRLTLGREKVEAVMDASNLTPTADTFGLVKLGQITLATELRGESLKLSAGDKTGNALLIRQLVITRTRAAAN
ncbi:hypothetical protein WJU23_08590 [Prosthecobacter sp. SYSU 5D2]|uniref:hypothetical protein n=1 Tax=Prosthecobacter sp. SYSU 5D2 TaxID=3134134 RepID=UPI0031FEB13F